MANNLDEAYEKALKVLDLCSTSRGFYAAYPGYKGVWSRDSMIMSLGASLIIDKYRGMFEKSLITLAKGQSAKGQIPNAVMYNGRKIDYKSIDSSLWFVIGHYVFRDKFGGKLFKKFRKNIERAINWLSYQDMGEDGLLEQLPTTDWQDAFPHRYGHTINTQALWFKVLKLIGNYKEANRVKEVCNNSKDDGLWNGNYYIPWRWKNHNKYLERGEWFDSLGNLLAIVFELADKRKSLKILDYIKKKGIDRPYPIKAIDPPIRKGSRDWQDYFEDAEARTPYHYSNGGIWTFIGGFYVLALLKVGRKDEARKQLSRLAEANLLSPGFAEWLDGKSGRPGVSGDGSKDGNQGWNAGMYILAYESVKKGKVLL
jgi:glycogen debranching enzyme